MVQRCANCCVVAFAFRTRPANGVEVAGGGIRGRSCWRGCCQDRDAAASCGGLGKQGLGDVKNTFSIYVWLCPHCGGRRRLLTAIQEPAAIRKVLAAMGLSADVPELAAARSPPGEVGIEFSG